MKHSHEQKHSPTQFVTMAINPNSRIIYQFEASAITNLNSHKTTYSDCITETGHSLRFTLRTTVFCIKQFHYKECCKLFKSCVTMSTKQIILSIEFNQFQAMVSRIGHG